MPALPVLVLLFLVVPLVEIYVLIEVGQVIGALSTVALCVLTAVVGGALLRIQGITTMQRAQRSIARGEAPAMEMLEGVALAVGGGLLLTPGFVTDAIGFLCLVPWSRRALVRHLLERMIVANRAGGFPPDPPGSGRGRTIEGDFERGDDDTDRGWPRR